MSDRAERIAEKVIVRVCASLGHTTTSIPADAKAMITRRVQAMLKAGQTTEKELNNIVISMRTTFPGIDRASKLSSTTESANPTKSASKKEERRQSAPHDGGNTSYDSSTRPQLVKTSLPQVNKPNVGTESVTTSCMMSPGRYPAARISRANRLACDAMWANQISEDLERMKGEEEIRMKKMHEKRLEQRKLLDQQVQHRKEEKSNEEYRMQIFAQEQAELKKRWEDEINATTEQKRKALVDNQVMRQALLEERRRKLEEESKSQREEGKAWADQILSEVRQEETTKKEKKRECMQVFKTFIAENNHLAEVRKVEAAKEKQHDKEVLTQYAKLLEQQEKKGALERAMQSKRAQVVAQKQIAIMNNMSDLQKKLREEQLKRDQETERQLNERFEREQKAEERQKEIRKKEKIHFVTALEDQLSYKQNQKDHLATEQTKMRTEVDENTEQWMKTQEDQKKRMKAQREMALRELEEQTQQNIIKAQNPIKIKV
jgi:hypothetical protein